MDFCIANFSIMIFRPLSEAYSRLNKAPSVLFSLSMSSVSTQFYSIDKGCKKNRFHLKIFIHKISFKNTPTNKHGRASVKIHMIYVY